MCKCPQALAQVHGQQMNHIYSVFAHTHKLDSIDGLGMGFSGLK